MAISKTLKLMPEQILTAIELLSEEEKAYLEVLANKEFMSLGAKNEIDTVNGLPKNFVKELKKARARKKLYKYERE